jgi:glycosyltransferase involved in cell wall biosynthesis
VHRKHNLVPVILNMNDEFWLPYSLAALSGFFHKYVIYDVGSTDRSKEIIDWFVQKEKNNADFVVRYLPFVEPAVQGTFRNSMIAEADSDWYFIVDSDEVYNPEDLRKISQFMQPWDGDLQQGKYRVEKPYGIVRRVEIVEGLETAYGLEDRLSHHRVYHNTAYWKGTHPGEEPVKVQKETTEFWIPDAVCYHFHNTSRSSKDADVPKRVQRRSQATYHRGQLKPFNTLKEVPILRGQIEDFPRNPTLIEAQEDFMAGYQ